MRFALQSRLFAWMWAGQSASSVGNHLYLVAIAWWVIQTTGSGRVLSIVLLCHAVPMVLFGLFGGVIADRWHGSSIMWWCDIARCVGIGFLAALSAFGLLELWMVYFINVGLGVAEAVFEPAYSTLVPQVVPQEHLDGANSLTSMSMDMAAIVGPLLAGWCIAIWGLVPAFWLNSISFLCAALCVLPASRVQKPKHVEQESVAQALRQGLFQVARVGWIWRTLVLTAFLNLTTVGPLFVTMPSLVERTWDIQVYSLLLTLVGIGSVGSAFCIDWLRARWSPHTLMYAGFLSMGMGILCFATLVLPMIYLGGFMYGVGMLVANVMWLGSLQRSVQSEMLGRVISIDRVLSFALLPVSYAIAGVLTDTVGALPVLLGGGLLTIAVVLTGSLHTGMRFPSLATTETTDADLVSSMQQ